MIDENITGEQSENVETSLEENIMDSPEMTEDVQADLSEAERGVPIGRFKSVEDLYDAYNNLQAEFTRKSQKLSALEKEKTSAQPTITSEDAFKMFLSKNQEAYAYADEIKARIEKDENLSKDEAGITKVWKEMLFEKLSSPNRAKEPIIQNLILKDDEIQNMVIENYMKQLQQQRTPVVMSSQTGDRVTKTEIKRPDSFEEAKRVVLDLLN